MERNSLKYLALLKSCYPRYCASSEHGISELQENYPYSGCTYHRGKVSIFTRIITPAYKYTAPKVVVSLGV